MLCDYTQSCAQFDIKGNLLSGVGNGRGLYKRQINALKRKLRRPEMN